MLDWLTRHHSAWFLLAAAIVICGIIYWTSDLTSDPPTHFSGTGQSLATDPPQYVFHARNKVLFDDWDPFDYGRFTVFRHSLTSLTAWFWFSVAGVSQKQAAGVGVMLSLAGLVALLVSVGRCHRGWVTCSIAFCYLANVILLTFGRLPFLENGLIFIASLIFLVYTSWGHRMLGVIVAGALVAPAMLMGKVFGLLMLPALAGAILLMERKRRWLMLGASVAAFAVCGVALLAVLYHDSAARILEYAGEQGYGLYGLPPGLSAPWVAVEQFVSFGFQNRLWYHSPDLLVLLVLGIGMLVFLQRNGRGGVRISRVTALALSWTICGLLAFGQLSYSPIRYVTFCLPPIIVLFFTALDTFLASRDKVVIAKRGLVQTILLVVLLWICLYQVVANLFYYSETGSPVRWLVWLSLVPACLVVLLARRLIGERQLKLGGRTLIVVLVAALCCSAITNGFRIRRAHHSNQSYSLAAASMELPMILGRNAVVSGPYGPSLTLDTKIQSFIHMFGVAKADRTLFQRYPITHLALDLSNWQQAIEAYPQLSELPAIASYRIRDFEVRLFNISKVFNNPRAANYQESTYEAANYLYLGGNYDSARVEAKRFLRMHPRSVSGGLLLGDILWSLKRYDSLISQMTSLADSFPADYNVHLQCGRYLQMISGMREDPRLLTLARQHYQRAIDIDPYRQQEIQRLHDDLSQEQRQP